MIIISITIKCLVATGIHHAMTTRKIILDISLTYLAGRKSASLGAGVANSIDPNVFGKNLVFRDGESAVAIDDGGVELRTTSLTLESASSSKSSLGACSRRRGEGRGRGGEEESGGGGKLHGCKGSFEKAKI